MTRPDQQHDRDWLRPPLAGSGLSDFWAVYDSQYQEIGAATLAVLRAEPDLVEHIQSFSDQQPPERLRDLLADAIRMGDWSAYAAGLESLGAHYAQRGLRFHVWSLALRAFRSVMRERLLIAYGPSAERFAASIAAVDDLADMMLAVITEEYLRRRETIIRDQEAIRELSTPVLRVAPEVLVAPLVGVIDAVRAEQLTRQLLEAISRLPVRAIVFDVTGLHTIDAAFANHIPDMMAACRVMGTGTVISGLSAANAVILGRAGVDIPTVVTAGDLSDGIARASALVASGRF